MKKIPTLFERVYEQRKHGKKIVGIKDELTSPELQKVLDGECAATIKWDGSSMAYINGKWYKRYDAKNSKRKKKLKEKWGDLAIATQEHSDPTTGSKPYWVPLDENDSADKWYIEATKNIYDYNENKELIIDEFEKAVDNWTYEAIGPHFQSNPYNLNEDGVIRHGWYIIPHLTFRKITKEEIHDWLKNANHEGIVFWEEGDDEHQQPHYKIEVSVINDLVDEKLIRPLCKIKSSDFGIEWPIRRK